MVTYYFRTVLTILRASNANSASLATTVTRTATASNKDLVPANRAGN